MFRLNELHCGVLNKDSHREQYAVPKIENRRQQLSFKFGYFDSETSFQNSIIEEAWLCATFAMPDSLSSLTTPNP